MPAIDSALPPPIHAHWLHGVAIHGLRTLGIGLFIGLFLTLVSGSSLVNNLIYAECISICCWFFIDGGRVLAATLKHRHAPLASDAALNRWPGWGWMALCLVLGTVAGVAAGGSLGDWLTGRQWGVARQTGLRPMLAMLAFSILPGVGVSYYYYSKQRLRAAEARAESARGQAAENQLKLLESQLEPHMLFNTLANLRVLIALDAPRAQAMLDQLISFLRATLGASRVTQQPLAAEFDRLRDYLALMQVRMGDRLRLRFELPQALQSASVPPLLLQPLVENSIKHALEPNIDGGRIDISAARDGDTLLLRVRDTGSGLLAAAEQPAAHAGTHFGLQQVRERLATLYGDAASLQLAAADDDGEGGTLATVRLPLRFAQPASA